MLIRDFLPAPVFKEFVQCYRIVHFDFRDTNEIPYKAYPPKPEQCLHFFLRDPFAIEIDLKKVLQPPILMSGQQTSLVKQFNGQDFLDVQIVLQPTAVFRLTGIPAQELTNQFIDASLIFSGDLKDTFEQLQEATSYEQMLRIAETYIQSLIAHSRRDFHILDSVSQQMKQSYQAFTIDGLAKQTYLCTKQFKRKFQERIGVNPKTYSRIIRLNKAYNLKNRFVAKGWDLIASRCGYTDYQHLSKDYKDFTGLTPPELHLLERMSPESVLNLTEMLYKMRATF